MKPFIKWVGGKHKLLPQILPFFPSRIETYYEPFLGGGSVFFALASGQTGIQFEKAMLGDLNTDLIVAYQTVKEAPAELIKCLKGYQEEYKTGKGALFQEIKDARNCFPSKLSDSNPSQASRFIFLNKTGFNGLWRVNSKGGYNVPWGKYENPTICDEERILECSVFLQGDGLGRHAVQIMNGPYQGTVASAKRGDCVYFDPPYVPLNPTSNFASYTSDGFGKPQQEELAKVAGELLDRGVHVVASNSDTQLVRDLWHRFEIHEIMAARAVNSKGSGRGLIKELVLVGKP